MARPPKKLMKKMIAISVLALLSMEASETSLPEEEPGTHLPHRPLNWLHHVRTVGKGKGFKEMYRLPLASFCELQEQ